MSLLIYGATIIDGLGGAPVENGSVWIEGKRIRAVGRQSDIGMPPAENVIDARGKFIIPGLMNANVHLLCDLYLETLARYWGRYEELITEAAQVALKNGVTTVFDTAGPRRFLTAVRDRINAGEVVGSRIFCAGWLVGLDGPYSEDFLVKVREIASPAFVRRINSLWVENAGRHLMWLTPEQVAAEVRTYIQKGVDFIKYASNDHAPGAFLAFSPRVQAAIVKEAHDVGLTAQAHTLSVEGLQIALEAGCDLIQHVNLTGPVAIPAATLELLERRNAGAVVFPLTQRALEWFDKKMPDHARTMWKVSDTNTRNLIRSGARILLANDGAVFSPEALSEPSLGEFWKEVAGDAGGGMYNLGEGHFGWFTAMEEKGCLPMEMLRAATYNIAAAYGKQQDLGTLEPGKCADLLILDKNPLQNAAHYRAIHRVVKEGAVVDRDALPSKPVLTKPMEPALEEGSYKPFLSAPQFPMCPMCLKH